MRSTAASRPHLVFEGALFVDWKSHQRRNHHPFFGGKMPFELGSQANSVVPRFTATLGIRLKRVPRREEARQKHFVCPMLVLHCQEGLGRVGGKSAKARCQRLFLVGDMERQGLCEIAMHACCGIDELELRCFFNCKTYCQLGERADALVAVEQQVGWPSTGWRFLTQTHQAHALDSACGAAVEMSLMMKVPHSNAPANQSDEATASASK